MRKRRERGPQGPHPRSEERKKDRNRSPESLRTAPEGTAYPGLGLLGAVQPLRQSAPSRAVIGGLPWPPWRPPPSCLGFTSPKYTGPTLWSNRSCMESGSPPWGRLCNEWEHPHIFIGYCGYRSQNFPPAFPPYLSVIGLS